MKHVARHFKGIIHALFWEVDYKAFEVFNGVTILILGVSFFFLRSSQYIVSQAEINSVFAFPTYYTIAVIMVIFGVLKVYAISQGRLVARKWLALAGTFMWGFLFTVFLTPPVKPSSIVFILILVAFSMWAFIRLVLEHRGRRLLDPRDSFRNL